MSEAADWPSSYDSFADQQAKADPASKAVINKIQNVLEALESTIGLVPQGTRATLVARLAIMMATNGALAQGASFPVSPTPVAGQLFYRTDLAIPYWYDGAQWNVLKASNITFYDADGTFTPSTDTVFVTAIGGGAAGAARATDQQGGWGGGGSGQYVINYVVSVAIGVPIAVTVGDGGVADTASTGVNGFGNPGGDTIFGSYLTVKGGDGVFGVSGSLGGGNAENSDGTNAAGAVGGVGGTIKKFNGNDGGDGDFGAGVGAGGGGAGSAFGNGGDGGANNANGSDADGFGAGGGGGGHQAAHGGNGTQGFLMVIA